MTDQTLQSSGEDTRYKDIEDFFAAPLTLNQWKWCIWNNLVHWYLTIKDRFAF